MERQERYDTTEEARFIKIKIKEQLKKGVKPNDICVLFRSSRSSNILEGILNQESSKPLLKTVE